MEEKLRAVIDMAKKIGEFGAENGVGVIGMTYFSNELAILQVSMPCPGLEYVNREKSGKHCTYFFEKKIDGLRVVSCVTADDSVPEKEVLAKYGF